MVGGRVEPRGKRTALWNWAGAGRSSRKGRSREERNPGSGGVVLTITRACGPSLAGMEATVSAPAQPRTSPRQGQTFRPAHQVIGRTELRQCRAHGAEGTALGANRERAGPRPRWWGGPLRRVLGAGPHRRVLVLGSRPRSPPPIPGTMRRTVESVWRMNSCAAPRNARSARGEVLGSMEVMYSVWHSSERTSRMRRSARTRSLAAHSCHVGAHACAQGTELLRSSAASARGCWRRSPVRIPGRHGTWCGCSFHAHRDHDAGGHLGLVQPSPWGDDEGSLSPLAVICRRYPPSVTALTVTRWEVGGRGTQALETGRFAAGRARRGVLS